MVSGHQSFTNKSAVELRSAPLCIPDKMTSSRPLLCLFLPQHAPFCSPWRHWCFWLKYLFPRPESNHTLLKQCIVVSTAATPPPPPLTTTTTTFTTDWCPNPGLGRDPPGDHQSSPQERARTQGERARRVEAMHTAELHHELVEIRMFY